MNSSSLCVVADETRVAAAKTEKQEPVAPHEPEWFRQALSAEVELAQTIVDGVCINYRAWGDRADPAVLLVHGEGAHAQWWDHIGPLLSQDRRVVALDLSGHGDSGHRTEYSVRAWADEVIHVAELIGLHSPPILVGHSLGGMVTSAAARLYGTQLTAVITVDAPLPHNWSPEQARARRQEIRVPGVYANKSDAIGRFRLIPSQAHTLDFVMRHLANTSVKPVPCGWGWKYDPAILGRDIREPIPTAEPLCPIVAFRSERGSLLDLDFTPYTLTPYPFALRPAITLPNTEHHVMVDEPLVLVAALRTALSSGMCQRPARQ